MFKCELAEMKREKLYGAREDARLRGIEPMTAEVAAERLARMKAAKVAPRSRSRYYR